MLFFMWLQHTAFLASCPALACFLVAPPPTTTVAPLLTSWSCRWPKSGGISVGSRLRGGACRTIIRSFNHLSKPDLQRRSRRKNPRMDHRNTPIMTGATAMEHRTPGARNGLRPQGVALTRRQRRFWQVEGDGRIHQRLSLSCAPSSWTSISIARTVR